MKRYTIEKAEEGTQAADAYLAAGFEPFAVVSTPVESGIVAHYDGNQSYHGSVVLVSGYVNVIWFRRVLA